MRLTTCRGTFMSRVPGTIVYNLQQHRREGLAQQCRHAIRPARFRHHVAHLAAPLRLTPSVILPQTRGAWLCLSSVPALSQPCRGDSP
jgi:hypothetical protein